MTTTARQTSAHRTHAPASLHRVMERYAAGDDTAFAVLHRALAPRIRARLARMVHDAALVEDLLQTTFLRAHTARDRFASVGDGADRAVEGWYLSIARNVALDHLREHYRRERRHASMIARGDVSALGVSADAPNAEELRVREEQRDQTAQRVHEALARLPATQRDVVELHKLEGFSMADVAEKLHVQQGAVRVRAHRAYKALSTLLQGAPSAA